MTRNNGKIVMPLKRRCWTTSSPNWNRCTPWDIRWNINISSKHRNQRRINGNEVSSIWITCTILPRYSIKRTKVWSIVKRTPSALSFVFLVIEEEIRFYLTTYSDDAHLIDYYIRHGLYSQAFQHKCSLNVFRDHIYLALLRRNQINQLFSYISTPLNHPLTHHLRYMCTHFKEQNMQHSLQQLLVFMNDYMGAASTAVKIFTMNPTTYPDLCAKRLVYLLKALEYYKQAKMDTEQTMLKVQR